jgi:pilus assembly protein Flp/PilA
MFILKCTALDDDGATMVEYALLVGLIAIVAFVGISLFGTSVSGLYTTIASAIPELGRH